MSGPYYAVLDIHKYHSTSSLRQQEAHNERDYEMKHVDNSLSYMNKELVSTGGISYAQRWREIIKTKEALLGHKIAVRKNAVIAYDIVTAMTPGAEKALDINIDDWCEANKQFMIDTFGEENIICMTLHMDENDEVEPMGRRGTHIHTQVVPIDERGHLCARSFTGTKTMMKNLHTKYHEGYMKQFGLERGEPNSKLKHTNRKRWYRDVEDICTLKAPRIQDGETMEEYLNRLDKEWQDMHLTVAKTEDKANKRVAKSETRQAQIFGEYAYAINLQHILEEEFGGDMRKVNDRLKTYQMMEKSVPQHKVTQLLEAIRVKYPATMSLNCYRMGKKKKHAKWESIPDLVTDESIASANASSGDEKYDDIEKMEEVVTEESTAVTTEGKSSSLLEGEGKAKYEEKYKDDEENLLANDFGEKLED
jgi:hypothetical protein